MVFHLKTSTLERQTSSDECYRRHGLEFFVFCLKNSFVLNVKALNSNVCVICFRVITLYTIKCFK